VQNPNPPQPAEWPQQFGQPACRKRRWPWIVGGVVGMFAIIAIAGNAGSGSTGWTAAQLAVAPTVAATGPQDGTYVVGTDIKAGTWHTSGGGTLGVCYWERDKDLDGDFSSIITNDDNAGGPSTVAVHSTDKSFKVTGGCPWSRIGG
jgi:hypothetical protein